MDKAKAVAICIFILVLAFIYVHQNSNNDNTESTPQPDDSRNRRTSGFIGGSTTTIIVEPTLSLSVYEDENCTTNFAGVDWGAVYPGENKSSTIYLKNTGDGNVRPTLYASDWVFKDDNDTVLSSDYQQYFNLIWDKEGVTIKPSEVVGATLTLSVSSLVANVTSFGFSIHLGWVA